MTALILIATAVVLFCIFCYGVSHAMKEEGGSSHRKDFENYYAPIMIMEEDV